MAQPLTDDEHSNRHVAHLLLQRPQLRQPLLHQSLLGPLRLRQLSDQQALLVVPLDDLPFERRRVLISCVL
jgi:hypothetical protein